MPEREIRIVTDSTADLPDGYAEENRVTVIPLHVTFPKGGLYKDGVDLSAKDFYPMLLAAGDDIPKTSTPTKEEFHSVYQQILQESPECQIISIHISGGLSSTVSIAEAAARDLNQDIYTFDSRQISFGTGMQVMEAVRLREEGAGVKKILDHLQLVSTNTETMFCLNTMEYLEKGGRIGKAAAFIGSILNIKLIIHVKDGVYEAFDKVRSQRQAIQKMADRGLSLLGERKPLRLGVIHGAGEIMGEMLKAKVEEAYGKAADCFKETGPVIGVHTGPGTVGMSVCHL